MRVEFNPAIKSASGTHRSAASYQRSGKPSEKEIAARELFAKRQAFVRELMASGAYHSKAEAWKIAKKQIN